MGNDLIVEHRPIPFHNVRHSVGNVPAGPAVEAAVADNIPKGGDKGCVTTIITAVAIAVIVTNLAVPVLLLLLLVRGIGDGEPVLVRNLWIKGAFSSLGERDAYEQLL